MDFTGFTTSDFDFSDPFPKSNRDSARRHLKLFLERLKERLPRELQSFNYTHVGKPPKRHVWGCLSEKEKFQEWATSRVDKELTEIQAVL